MNIFFVQTRKSSSSSSNYPVANPPYPVSGYPGNDPYPTANDNSPYPSGNPTYPMKSMSGGGGSYPRHTAPYPGSGLYPANPLYPHAKYPNGTGISPRYPAGGRFHGSSASLAGGYPLHSPPGNGLARSGPGPTVQQPYPQVYPPTAMVAAGGPEDWGQPRTCWPQQSTNNYHEEVQFPPQVSSIYMNHN